MNDNSLAPLRYSIQQAARLLGLSRSTLYARIAEGKLATQKDGRRSFVTAQEISLYLERLQASSSVPGAAR